MRSAELELDLDVFAGPFDLLLAIVLREEISLLEVPLGENRPVRTVRLDYSTAGGLALIAVCEPSPDVFALVKKHIQGPRHEWRLSCVRSRSVAVQIDSAHVEAGSPPSSPRWSGPPRDLWSASLSAGLGSSHCE